MPLDKLEQLRRLTTEGRNPRSADLDRLGILGVLERIAEEDARVPAAVKAALPEIAKVAEMAAASFREGGRLIYVGAGTSGRLGVLDASECPPTFGSDPSQVVGIIAGGPEALMLSKEGLEDRPELGAADLGRLDPGPPDTVLGISASHCTPYTVGAVREAERRGCRSAFLTCNAEVDVPGRVAVRLVVGPEALSGSTRMKAGSAQKMALNMISTGAMVLTGKVYENLMVDLVPWSDKLVERGRGMIMEVAGLEYEEAAALLDEAGGVKTALCMALAGLDRAEAEARLDAAGGLLRRALEWGAEGAASD